MRQHISSRTIWEQRVGFSRALRVGPLVFVSGTTATDEQGRLVGPGDAYAQTVYILQKIGRALAEAGATMEQIVRTRIYVTNAALWEQVGRAHGEYLGAVRPANTLLEVSALVGEGYLVEIEADAVIDELL
jgi:enamine deaminase RidA (YjgF/YER057c/UK114 family)